MSTAALCAGPGPGAYGFSGGHPFGPDRQQAFLDEARRRGLDRRAQLLEPQPARREDVLRFHPPGYVDRVQRLCATGDGLLDGGDTPAEPGLYEAALAVCGATLTAAEHLMQGTTSRALVPIAGLHHARRDAAAGFCVFNDIGVLIETLRARHGLQHILYVDIDAHHGDGVFYAYESDPRLWILDLHEDGRFLYPGTGAAGESGTGAAAGTKLNLPLPPGAGDRHLARALDQAAEFLDACPAEFVILQCGADSVGGDPLAHLALDAAGHGRVAAQLCTLAQHQGHGRVLALGGGGYDRRNLAQAWCAVLEALLDTA